MSKLGMGSWFKHGASRPTKVVLSGSIHVESLSCGSGQGLGFILILDIVHKNAPKHGTIQCLLPIF